MKKTILILSVLTSILLSCNNPDKENSTSSADIKTVIKPADEDDQNSLLNLQKTYSQEIGGLWKLYKTEYISGDAMVERDNSFMEIKADRKFSENNRAGVWFLSFCKDTSGIVALFTKVQPYSSNEVKISVSRISKTVENGTTFLQMQSLTDGKKSMYIRQQ